MKSDGNSRIFRTDLAGGEAVNLTPGETLHRNAPFVADNDPSFIVYSARAASDRTAHVYLQKLDGTAPREIHGDPQSGSVAAIAADGKHLLFRTRCADPVFCSRRAPSKMTA